eukprot:GSChrysophyteH1.ASY1.ANO1.1992.1 assembled CDS
MLLRFCAKRDFAPSNAIRSAPCLLFSSSVPVKPVRVRFAPSPTGQLHLGGARTALFNWLLARKTKGDFLVRIEDTDEARSSRQSENSILKDLAGDFLVRIEDTDEARSSRQSENSILKDLEWLQLHWDEGPGVDHPYGPYRQSERKEIYQNAEARGLQGSKYDANGEPYTVRFKVPHDATVSIKDCVRGTVTWRPADVVGDFIIVRSNGMPVYNYCVAVDDANMRISHVIRAEEHLTNTLKQVLVLQAMGCEPPKYAHCSLILGPDKQKLSKRHGAASLQHFDKIGILPSAMVNYLANLGWNDGTAKEIYTLQELIEAFDLNRIVKKSAIFDMDKLKWVNSQHLKALPVLELADLVLKDMRSHTSMISPQCTDADAGAFAKQAKCLDFRLEDTIANDATAAEMIKSDAFRTVVTTVISDFDAGKFPAKSQLNSFRNAWKAYVHSLESRLGLKGKNLFHPLRIALTGRLHGPDVGDQVLLLYEAANVASPLVDLPHRIGILRNRF